MSLPDPSMKTKLKLAKRAAVDLDTMTVVSPLTKENLELLDKQNPVKSQNSVPRL